MIHVNVALTTRVHFHTFHWQLYPDLSGRNSAVECQLPKLDVAGSTPVARSKLFKINYSSFGAMNIFERAKRAHRIQPLGMAPVILPAGEKTLDDSGASALPYLYERSFNLFSTSSNVGTACKIRSLWEMHDGMMSRVQSFLHFVGLLRTPPDEGL
jgi:hypothetical protein